MNIFYDLQEKMRRMDENYSSVRASTSASKRIENSASINSYEERQKQKQKNKGKSFILLTAGAIGTIVLLYIFIRLYIVIGDCVFNSSIFWVIATIGLIGMALYMLFILGSLVYGSFAEAKISGGRSLLALAVFLMLLAAVFTLMNRCT